MKPAPIDTTDWMHPTCAICGELCRSTVPAYTTSRWYCETCTKNYDAIQKKETTHMTTQEVRDTEAPPAETNGHANGRKRKSAAPSSVVDGAEAFLAAQQDIVYARNGHLNAIDAEIKRLMDVRERLIGQHVANVKTPRAQTKRQADAKPKIVGSGGLRKRRTPRENSVPSRVLEAISIMKIQTAHEISQRLNLEPVKVHGALNSLLKAGKVSSSGARKERVWSVAE